MTDMKQSLFAGIMFVLALVVAGVSPASAQQAPKFGYINSQQILAQAPGAAAAQQAFEADMERYRAEIQKFEQELESLRTEYERQQATLSAAAKQQKQQEIQQKFATYQQRVAELEQTAQRRQAELVSPIMERISKVIEEIREEGDYVMIFDAAAGSLITADPSLDLTDRVLSRLRSE
jgi:outer membrane protein